MEGLELPEDGLIYPFTFMEWGLKYGFLASNAKKITGDFMPLYKSLCQGGEMMGIDEKHWDGLAISAVTALGLVIDQMSCNSSQYRLEYSINERKSQRSLVPNTEVSTFSCSFSFFFLSFSLLACDSPRFHLNGR
jgi:hypothetical protein